MTSLPDLQLLNAQQVAELFKLDDATIYKMAQRGELPCIRIRKSIRFRPTDLAAFLDQVSNPEQSAAQHP